MPYEVAITYFTTNIRKLFRHTQSMGSNNYKNSIDYWRTRCPLRRTLPKVQRALGSLCHIKERPHSLLGANEEAAL